MSRSIAVTMMAAALLASAVALAQAPPGAPAGATGSCKDGSYTTASSRKGACRGHRGVQDWYASVAAANPAAPAPAAAGGKKKRSSRNAAAEAAPAATPPAAIAPVASPASAAGATGQCRDGSYSTAASRKGACRGHKGVKEWYGAAAPAAAPAAATPAVAARAPSAPAAPAATRPSHAPTSTAAPGGGAGLVWANKETKVYHCQGDRWYGKTRQGAYLSGADAKAQGYRPDHGKACQN